MLKLVRSALPLSNLVRAPRKLDTEIVVVNGLSSGRGRPLASFVEPDQPLIRRVAGNTAVGGAKALNGGMGFAMRQAGWPELVDIVVMDGEIVTGSQSFDLIF